MKTQMVVGSAKDIKKYEITKLCYEKMYLKLYFSNELISKRSLMDIHCVPFK